MVKLWRNNKRFILFIGLMLFFRSAVADWYHVPSGSMQPNILVGDRVWVNKLAYDAKLPLLGINLLAHHAPEAGDVVVFNSTAADNRLVKRVIGVPGDKVSMVANRLVINGNPVPLIPIEESQAFDSFLNDRQQAVYLSESLSKTTEVGKHTIRLSRLSSGSHQFFDELVIPPAHFLVLGDNRDNSRDSRWIGLVPRKELVGRAEKVVVSLDSENFYLPRNGRYFVDL